VQLGQNLTARRIKSIQRFKWSFSELKCESFWSHFSYH
jgi:hypothetical protein